MFKEATDVFKDPSPDSLYTAAHFYTTVLYVSHKYAAAQQLNKVEVRHRLSQKLHHSQPIIHTVSLQCSREGSILKRGSMSMCAWVGGGGVVD